MKTSVKWIIGIVIALIVVGMIVVVGYLIYSQWGSLGWETEVRAGQLWRNDRQMPWQDMPWQDMHRDDMPWHRMPGQPGWLLPGSRFTGFFSLRGLFGGLICLGLVLLLIKKVLS
jgi:hypothetical protein